jgi:hypothetical protein
MEKRLLPEGAVRTRGLRLAQQDVEDAVEALRDHIPGVFGFVREEDVSLLEVCNDVGIVRDGADQLRSVELSLGDLNEVAGGKTDPEFSIHRPAGRAHKATMITGLTLGRMC